MTEKLKPCPFCKSENCETFTHVAMTEYGLATGSRYVMCRNCKCQGPEKDSEEEAVKAWNRRASK